MPIQYRSHINFTQSTILSQFKIEGLSSYHKITEISIQLSLLIPQSQRKLQHFSVASQTYHTTTSFRNTYTTPFQISIIPLRLIPPLFALMNKSPRPSFCHRLNGLPNEITTIADVRAFLPVLITCGYSVILCKICFCL